MPKKNKKYIITQSGELYVKVDEKYYKQYPDNRLVEKKDIHTAYDYITFTRPGYLQNTKIYNMPHEDGSIDYIEIPINKDNSYDRENVKYISEGNVKHLA